MRKLRIGTWTLSTILVAVVARAIISGITFAAEVSGALLALALLATLLLARRGRQLEPLRIGSARRDNDQGPT